MTSFPPRAVLRLRLPLIMVLTVLLSASPLTAGGALAQGELYPGAVALIANTGGDPILLRETPSFDAAVLASFYEETPADVLEGPVYDGNGSAWYGIAIGGLTGYVVGSYLTESTPTAAPVPVELAPVELAQEAVSAESVAADALPAPAASLAEIPANPVATADLNLRAGPSYADAVMLVIPAGTPLTTTGEFAQGFAGVAYGEQYGWVDTSWLGSGEAALPEAVLLQEAVPGAAPATTMETTDQDALIGDLAAAPAGEVATAVNLVNLRAGPSYADDVLRVIPLGGTVTVTGPLDAGWAPTWYNGTWGYVSAEFLAWTGADAVELAQEAAPGGATSAPAPELGPLQLQATTLSDVNLRTGPELSAPVLGTIPAGITLPALAGPEQGFYQVQYGDQTGWAAAEFLDVFAGRLQRGERDGQQDGKVEGSEPANDAGFERGAGGIIWPVSGGLWYVMQGYNGSSHQNQDGLWQYYYSLDLARRDGNTAGQQVISPVNGVVRWTDPGSGGISIDIGNGHAVAMYHVAFMAGLEAGSTVRQGQYLGEVSGPGGPGFAGTPHVHFTLWQSDDEGNWDRQAVPFTGQYAIGGMEFPDVGGRSQHAGTEFSP